METKDQDQPTQPERAAARMPAAATGSAPIPTAQPLPGHTTPLIGLPVVPVAVLSPDGARPLAANGSDAHPERPAGVVEGVTRVEPRADPGNDSELDSVILSPEVTAEHAAHEAQTRSATTVRTRARRRGRVEGDSLTQANPLATRRSATLLALLVAVALLLTGVSSLFRSGAASDAEPAEADKAALGPAALARDTEPPDAQARHPQPPDPTPPAEATPPVIAPGDSTETAFDHAALLPAPDSPARANSQTSESEGPTEVVSVRSRDLASKKVGTRAASQPRSNARSSAARAPQKTSSVAEAYPTLPAPTPAATVEGKSWIKVRE